ncbi:MAG: right-handed parallel beta-helix repeat-containing protein [Promethearchaeota archaeon]
MKKQIEKIIVLLLIFIGFTLGTILPMEFKSTKRNIEEKTPLEPKNSGYWYYDWPIKINNTDFWIPWEYYRGFPWCRGNGTIDNPYKIENLTINVPIGFDYTIYIINSDVYFIIKNCTIVCDNFFGIGMILENVTNGQIIQCKFQDVGAIHIESDCNNIVIKNNTLNEGGIAIFGKEITVFDNIINDNSIYVSNTKNTVFNNYIFNGQISVHDDNHTIYNNKILNSSSDGIYIEGNENVIEFNDVINCSNNGIYIKGEENSIRYNLIKNCTYHGIDMYPYSDYNIIEGNTIENCQTGVQIYEVDNISLVDNSIKCEQYGVYLYNVQNLTLSGNQMFNCGIYLYDLRHYVPSIIDGDNNFVNGRHFYYYQDASNLYEDDFIDAGQIILINCNDSLIYHQNLSSATVGISLKGCKDIWVIENEINNNYEYAIMGDDNQNMRIINNQVKYNKYSIATDSSYAEIENNEICGTTIGIDANDNSIIRNNTIYDVSGSLWAIYTGSTSTVQGNLIINSTGIRSYGNYATITNNTIKYHRYRAIYLHGSYNTVEKNRIIGDVEKDSDGIKVDWSSTNNLIENNTIYNCKGFSIKLDEADHNIIRSNYISTYRSYSTGVIWIMGDSRNNSIYLNTVISHLYSRLAWDDGINNKWDFNSMGNYWSDYGGVDADDDGIGDLPYDISGSAESQDHFPKWWDAPKFVVNEPVENQEFGKDAPYLNITIQEGIAYDMWYSLDNGSTTYHFNLYGSINQDAWNEMPEGTITIQIYVVDFQGYITVKEINVSKKIEEQKQNIPSDCVILSIIIGLMVISIAFWIDRKKKITTKI